MRVLKVYRNGTLAGTLTENNKKSYLFEYNDLYFYDVNQPSISLTLPKTKKEYTSEYLFPFFYHLMSEGANKKLQCIQLRIDEKDSFGLLSVTAQYDTAGAITLKPSEP